MSSTGGADQDAASAACSSARAPTTRRRRACLRLRRPARRLPRLVKPPQDERFKVDTHVESRATPRVARWRTALGWVGHGRTRTVRPPSHATTLRAVKEQGRSPQPAPPLDAPGQTTPRSGSVGRACRALPLRLSRHGRPCSGPPLGVHARTGLLAGDTAAFRGEGCSTTARLSASVRAPPGGGGRRRAARAARTARRPTDQPTNQPLKQPGTA